MARSSSLRCTSIVGGLLKARRCLTPGHLGQRTRDRLQRLDEVKVHLAPGQVGQPAARLDEPFDQRGFAVARLAGIGQYPALIAGPQRVERANLLFAVGEMFKMRREWHWKSSP